MARSLKVLPNPPILAGVSWSEFLAGTFQAHFRHIQGLEGIFDTLPGWQNEWIQRPVERVDRNLIKSEKTALIKEYTEGQIGK